MGNSPVVKGGNLLLCAEMLSRGAGEVGDLGALQNDMLLLSLLLLTAGEMWQQIQGGSGQLLSRMAGKVLERAKAPLQPHWDVSVHFSSLGFQNNDFKQTSGKWPLRNKRWFSLFLKGRLNSLSGITVLTEDREGWITISNITISNNTIRAGLQ